MCLQTEKRIIVVITASAHHLVHKEAVMREPDWIFGVVDAQASNGLPVLRRSDHHAANSIPAGPPCSSMQTIRLCSPLSMN